MPETSQSNGGHNEPLEKDVAGERADLSASLRKIWRRLTGNWKLSGLPRLPRVIRIVLGVAVLAVLMLVVGALYARVPAGGAPGIVIDFPKEWSFGGTVMRWLDDIVDWMVVSWDPFFSAVNIVVLRNILVPLERFLLWLPWWLVIIGTGFLAWRMVSVRFAAVAMAFLLAVSFTGLLDLAMMTLALTLTATLLCVVLGLPLGIIAAKSNRFEGIMRPFLDAMQTMPSFVYLIPALMLFGLGRTPAVMATLIYAVAPVIRLTNLGIRQVDPSVVEASRAFGATPWQLLAKVQFPLALPSILAGLNQTVMMALAMVIIASMIGAKGLGAEVLTGIARLEVGRGFIAGTSIVFMAIILDRISQALGKRREIRRAT